MIIFLFSCFGYRKWKVHYVGAFEVNVFNVYFTITILLLLAIKDQMAIRNNQPSQENIIYAPLILSTNLNCFSLIFSHFYYILYTLTAPNSKAQPHTSLVTGRHKRDNGIGFLINSVSPVHRTTGYTNPQQSPNHPFSAKDLRPRA